MMYFNVPPFIICDERTGAVTGATYDFVQNVVAPALGVTFVWEKEPTAVPRQLLTLERLDNYASALLVYSPERAARVKFTDHPYYEASSVIAVLRTSRIKKVSRVEDILGLTIGYGDGLYVGPFMKDKRIRFDSVSSADFVGISLRKMMLGRIDAAYAPNAEHLSYAVRKLGIAEKIRIIDLPSEWTGLSLAFSKSSGDIAQRYNRVFSEKYIKETFTRILKKYSDPQP